ncbi:uncharacterized protein si:ch211-110p13.9 isoform X2 [Corythoichthys intestinalis]|uniref:uncharacterized protein si:ch211-110p13.9 isoform X2 n=1 Tax=Corythoichthys intestinalis TaxID=161448 RepID=UPI0025A5718F|nr:uncharacterized protein si:ch211-110p13.9 isoform X2 [Corythoichthys intestinalis]
MIACFFGDVFGFSIVGFIISRKYCRKNMSNFSFLSLPHWDGVSRKIRYFYLVNESSFTLTEGPHKSSLASVPLFLGADLLANTNVRSENHPRHHAKFARKGLATKIHFSSAFRFQGLKVAPSNNGLWFYTIHGLFRVAFEMYTKREQLAVLDNFQDVWKSQMSDSALKTSYSLTVQLDTAAGLNAVNETPNEQTPKQLENTNKEMQSDHCYSTLQSSETLSALGNKLRSLSDKLATINLAEHHQEPVLLLLDHAECYLSGTAAERDAAETSLAGWLGRRFAAAHADISRRVEAFKERHIQRIGELPPAEELSTQLFPDAMRTLLLNWMGLSRDEDWAKRQSEYPILLLMLEFANHNLITGVAHVLYSTLICK